MLPERKMMRIIAKGHEVPWPEPLVDRDVVFPKDYRMNGFPHTDYGGPWYDIPDDVYFSWLADYLPVNIPELTAEQRRLSNNLDNYNSLSGFMIGNLGGWYESEAAFCPNYNFPADFPQSGDLAAARLIDGGITYEEYAETNQDILEQEERLMTPEEFILDQYGWHVVQEEEKRQFDKYWPDFSKLDGLNIIFSSSTVYNEPPDAGWRIYLAMVLQRSQSKKERIKEIKDFYYYWQEMASK